jgi:hypothetical protein
MPQEIIISRGLNNNWAARITGLAVIKQTDATAENIAADVQSVVQNIANIREVVRLTDVAVDLDTTTCTNCG